MFARVKSRSSHPRFELVKVSVETTNQRSFPEFAKSFYTPEDNYTIHLMKYLYPLYFGRPYTITSPSLPCDRTIGIIDFWLGLLLVEIHIPYS